MAGLLAEVLANVDLVADTNPGTILGSSVRSLPQLRPGRASSQITHGGSRAHDRCNCGGRESAQAAQRWRGCKVSHPGVAAWTLEHDRAVLSFAAGPRRLFSFGPPLAGADFHFVSPWLAALWSERFGRRRGRSTESAQGNLHVWLAR